MDVLFAKLSQIYSEFEPVDGTQLSKSRTNTRNITSRTITAWKPHVFSEFFTLCLTRAPVIPLNNVGEVTPVSDTSELPVSCCSGCTTKWFERRFGSIRLSNTFRCLVSHTQSMNIQRPCRRLMESVTYQLSSGPPIAQERISKLQLKPITMNSFKYTSARVTTPTRRPTLVTYARRRPRRQNWACARGKGVFATNWNGAESTQLQNLSGAGL
ncbi:hypothetical protein B566_EDAN006339, partial [Ephemera danica]